MIGELRGNTKIIKRGAKGCVYIKGEEMISIPAPKVENVVDTTGPGDVLAGIFLVLRAEGFTAEKALLEAVRIASLSITDFGVEHLRGKSLFFTANA